MIVMASQSTMARLSPEDRDAVVAAGRDANAAARKFNDDKQDEYLKDLQSKGMTVVADIDRGAFIKALAGAEPAFQSMFGSELLSSIRNFGL